MNIDKTKHDEEIKKLNQEIKNKEDLLNEKIEEIKTKEELIKKEEEKYNKEKKEQENNIIKIEEEFKIEKEKLNLDINSLEEKVKLFENEIKHKEEKNKLEIDKYQKEISEANEKNIQLEKELNNEKERYKNLVEENKIKLTNDENELKLKEDKMKSEIEKQKQDILLNNELLSNKEKEINALKQQIITNEEKYKNDLNISLNEYKNKENELNTEIEKYKSQIQENSSEIKNKTEKLKVLEENLQILEEKYNKEKKEFETMKEKEENKIKMMEESNKTEKEKTNKEQNEKEQIIQKLEINLQNQENKLKQKEELILNLQEKNRSLEDNLKLNQEQNNVKLKENEEKLINLEKKLKDEINGYEEKIKNKEEQFKTEKDNYDKQLKEINEIKSKLNLEIEKYKKEILEKDKLLSNKEQNIPLENSNINKAEEKTTSSLNEKSDLLQDILSDILLVLDNSKHYLSLFDLLNKTLDNYDKLKYFQNTNANITDISLDHLYYFYLHIKSYFMIGQNNTSLNDLISQNSFIFSHEDAKVMNGIDLSEKIKTLNLGKNININEIYQNKKQNYMKKIEQIFDSLKQKVITDIHSMKNKNEITQKTFIKVKEPEMELEVNFDDLNKTNYLAKFQIFNSFNKLKELTLLISNFPIFLTYTLVVRCPDLHSLKIFYITEKSRSKNNENIENLCQVIPILIKLMNKLDSLELVNFPIKPNKIPDLVETLKTSKIKKLSLINCFPKKDGVNSLVPYFSYPNKALTDINISEYNFNIISFLSNSILNIQNNKNLVSISFTNCKLNEDDTNHIVNFIVASNTILYCDISKNILSPKSCSQFGYCISKTTSLETLKMNECGINGETLLFLFNAKGSKSIKKIYLNNNDLGDIGLVSIGAFIKNSPEMEIVEVKKCGGTDMGFMNLANTIKIIQGNKLKTVNYLENNITGTSLGILTQFNEIFKNKGVIFILNKIGNESDKIKLDCALFK